MEYKKIAKIACAVPMMVFLLLAVVGCSESYSQKEVDTKLATQKATLSSDALAAKALADKALSELKTSNDVKVAALKAEVEKLKVVVPVTSVSVSGYKLDDLEIGKAISKDLSDKQISKLVDSKVEFDGEDYDVEEYLSIDGLELSVNGEDYGASVFLTAEEEAISYLVKFESELDMSEVSEDETLEFSLLGKSVEVISWKSGEVELSQGVEYSLKEGESKTVIVNGVSYVVKLVYVDDDDAKFEVNGVSTKLLQVEDVHELAKAEIQLTDILYQNYAGGVHMVEFKIGEEVSVLIEDGEEYAEDSMWNWYVGDNELGLVLNAELSDLDEDEDFQAVAKGGKICLPENYVCLTFAGMDKEDVLTYKFDVDERKGNEYLEVSGDFTYDMEDYSRVYVDSEGIYDRDLEELGACVEMDGTEFSLCLVDGEVVLESSEEDIILELDLSDLTVDGESIADEDEDYLTNYGVKLSVPEDAVDDQKLEVNVPEEQLLGTVIVG